jgi:PAS domain S-box-containing protein
LVDPGVFEVKALAEVNRATLIEPFENQSALLDEIIQTIAQGVVVFDADARLVSFNQQYADFFDFPPNFLKPGMPIADIIRHRAETGFYGDGNIEEQINHHIERAAIRTERTEERSLPCGTAYVYHRKPMREGGFVVTYTDITEQKDTERRLRASEEKFRGAFNNAGIGIFIRSANGDGREYNQALCDMMGYSANELRRMRMRDIAHPDDDPESTSMRFVAFGDRDTETIERRFIRKDGKVIWCSINYKSVYDDRGRPVSTIGMYQEITERKRAEQEAAEKSRVLEVTFRNMVQGIAVYDRNEELIAFNPQYAQILDLPANFLRIGMTRSEIQNYRAMQGHYGPNPTEARIMRLASAAEEPRLGQRTLPNGRSYGFQHTPTPDGGYIRTVTDITEQRKAESLSLRLGRILDTSFNEIYVFDAKAFRFSQVNQGALNNLGYTREEISQLRPWDVKPDIHETEFRAMVEPLLRGEIKQLVFDTEHQRKDGSRYPVEVRLQYSSAETSPVFVAIVADISERKRAEKVINDAREQAELANRAKSEFLANVSHELRTPLNAIIGFSEVMMKGLKGPAGTFDYSEFTEGIHSAGQHLLGLINDILDLSKLEVGKVTLNEETLEPANLVLSCVNMVKGQAADEGLSLDEDLPDKIAPMRGDERMIKQILLNLLSNAVKFTPSGGKITIKAWSEPGAGHSFQVTDTGIGVASDEIPIILNPFTQIDSTLSRKYQGTGLGLTLAKNLTELHGGRLDFQSEPGVGSTVTVEFPKERMVD